MISPAERSASIAICLPGMESRVKRAATSAIRLEPLVITTKFTTTRMAKTITPMTNEPSIISLPKASMMPEDMSASIAICLPGIASRLNLAATSAMRPEPLVMTTKLTITRIANTIIPITKLPLITKLPNASMT